MPEKERETHIDQCASTHVSIVDARVKMDDIRKEESHDKISKSKLEQNFSSDEGTIKLISPSPKRYFILIMYAICSMEKSFQWINLSTITNKVSFYYGVDNIAVNWTSVLFMITFIPLVLPTGWLIERIGLRKAILIGSTGIFLGALIKCFSCFSDGFYIVIWGQIVVSLSEQFIFCVPARIASVWFPDDQVSLATGFGIFGNQCGIALGFIVPQAMLKGLESRDEIGQGLYNLFLGTTIVSFVTLLILLVLFDDAPKYAPGSARLRKIEEEKLERSIRHSFSGEMKLFGQLLYSLISNMNCALLCIAYGINVGTGYAIQTLLNQMITGQANGNWTDANRVVGVAGLVVIFCGMIGAIFWGHLCDLTRKYIMINKLLYVNAILSIALFGVALRWDGQYHEYLLYITCALLGFHLIGYTVVGLDTAVELTFPAPELISTSLMNLSPQIFGTIITFTSSSIVDQYESDAANVFLVIVLSVGLMVTLAVKEKLCRQQAVLEVNELGRIS